MKVREYLETLNKVNDATQVTFIVAHATKDENSPSYHDRFSTGSIRSVWEWLQDFTWPNDYIVLNADHPPVDITGFWVRDYKHGHLKCAIITRPEDLKLHYRNEEQYNDMLRWYDKESRKQLAESLKK